MNGNNGQFSLSHAELSAQLSALLATAIPRGLSESDALGFVEGSLSAADFERVASVLSANPATRGVLYAMRRDREGMRSIGAINDVNAFEGLPTDLVEQAIARSRMVISPATAGETIAVGRHVRLRRSGSRFSLPLPAVLGMAAAVAISSVAAIVVIALQGSGAMQGTGPIAINDQPPPDASGTSTRRAQTIGESGPALAKVEQDPAALTTLAQIGEDAEPTIGIDEAYELACTRRLVIRLETSDPVEASRRVARLAPEQRTFMVEAERDGAVSALLAAMFPARAPRALTQDPTALADRDGPRQPVVDLGTLDQGAPTPMRAHLIASRESFEALVLSLNSVEDVAVCFESLAVPMDLGPMLPRPEEIFWWRSSPGQWSGWTQVPAIIQKSSP